MAEGPDRTKDFLHSDFCDSAALIAVFPLAIQHWGQATCLGGMSPSVIFA